VQEREIKSTDVETSTVGETDEPKGVSLSIKAGGVSFDISLGNEESGKEKSINHWTMDLFRKKHKWMSEMEAQRAADVANKYLKVTGDEELSERMALKQVKHSGANEVDKSFKVKE
jgi:hypothetical protein